MKSVKGMLLFMLKSLVFSIIFICVFFVIFSISPFNSPGRNTPGGSNSINIEKYNRQIEESDEMMEKQLFKRAEANMTEQEKNTKRMSAILDMWGRQARTGK